MEVNQDHHERVSKALAQLLRAHPDFAKRALKIKECLAHPSISEQIKRTYLEAGDA